MTIGVGTKVTLLKHFQNYLEDDEKKQSEAFLGLAVPEWRSSTVAIPFVLIRCLWEVCTGLMKHVCFLVENFQSDLILISSLAPS